MALAREAYWDGSIANVTIVLEVNEQVKIAASEALLMLYAKVVPVGC